MKYVEPTGGSLALLFEGALLITAFTGGRITSTCHSLYLPSVPMATALTQTFTALGLDHSQAPQTTASLVSLLAILHNASGIILNLSLLCLQFFSSSSSQKKLYHLQHHLEGPHNLATPNFPLNLQKLNPFMR